MRELIHRWYAMCENWIYDHRGYVALALLVAAILVLAGPFRRKK